MWPALRIALDELSPWATRFLSYSIGALVLAVLVWLQRRSFRISFGSDWFHVLITAMLNVVAFGIFGTFAQLSTDTTRVIILNYSMPIWSSIMAWVIFREPPSMWVSIGLLLCAVGLSVLVYPIIGTSLHETTGLALGLMCSLAWASGTIYMKAVRIDGDLLAITMWQLMIGAVVFAIAFLVVQGPPALKPLELRTWLSVAYSGIFGSAFAYFLWYNILDNVPTATASLGTLLNPVVGIIGSVILLGERPTAADTVGFLLVLAASACVLLQPRRLELDRSNH
jgi:drug/metabolite transporter (DMT)-like permease